MDGMQLHYGDLHFHTHYSDNRERATVKTMVHRALQEGLTIIGTGDHNHNLTDDKWSDLIRESADLRSDSDFLRENPRFLLLNNCEMTFHAGHFLVVNPRKISGTVEEAFEYLHDRRSGLLIINHPVPGYDYWHERMVPHASAVEVINGAVIRKFRESGHGFRSILEIPMVKTYASYLAMNIPVAAVGNSDAHAPGELGTGVTGYWMKDDYSESGVEEAINSFRTFASTDRGISIDWGFDKESRLYSWKISIDCRDDETPFSLFLHNRDKTVGEAGLSGQTVLDESGLYWLSAFNGKRLALSSPQPAGDWSDDSIAAPLNALLDKSAERTEWEKMAIAAAVPDERGAHFIADRKLEILCLDTNPGITGAEGATVEYEPVSRLSLILPGQKGLVTDHLLSPGQVEEFIIWLNRNEVHEYRFAQVALSGVDPLILSGYMVPYWLIPHRNEAGRWKGLAGELANAYGEGRQIVSRIRDIPQTTLILKGKYELPLKICDKESGMVSEIHEIAASGEERDKVLIQRILI